MLLKIRHITDILENIAPLQLQESYDNSGLLIGSAEEEIDKLLITLDVTEEVIDEAIDKSCGMIIAHHPLIFGGIKRLTGSDLTERLVVKSIKNNIAIYAIHTNLDNVSNGVNEILTKKLNLINTKILSPKKSGLYKIAVYCPISHLGVLQDAMFNSGSGHIGNYDSCSYYSEGKGTFRALDGTNPYVGKQGELHTENEYRLETIVSEYNLHKTINAMLKAHPYEEPAYDIYKLENSPADIGSGMIGELKIPLDIKEYLQFVKTALGAQNLKHNSLINKKVKKVAICGGSGSFLIQSAARQNADVFITADIKYHDFFEYQGKMTIVDAGHYETEQPVKELIYEILKEKFPNFALQISEKSKNPVMFL